MIRCLSVLEFLFIVTISSSLIGGSTLMSRYSVRSDGFSLFSTSSKCFVHLHSLSDVSIFPSLYFITVQLLYGPAPKIAKQN